jgi:hypothetical protein
MEKNNTAKKVGLVTAAMVTSGSVFAEGIADSAKTSISAASADLTTVGGAIVAVIAGIWIIKRIVALIR